MERYRLLIACPDASGIIGAVASHIGAIGGNILEADQHPDPDERAFYMRIEFDPHDPHKLHDPNQVLGDEWNRIADRYQMTWRLESGAERRRVAILVSKDTHCLADLLWRWSIKELDADIPLVVSNHEAGRSIAESFGVRFEHVPIGNDKAAQERAVMDLLERERIDLVVLARYMRVLSPAFVGAYTDRIINIHHSFLPAFAGATPYRQAFDRGVKLIGATSHYVTEDLDEGPIIAQDTAHVTHRDTVDDLIRKGRDLERVVLARAVRLHLEDKILRAGAKTVVFD